MNCPKCGYDSQFEAVRCPECQSSFAATDLEELNQLVYLRERLETWRAEGQLPADVANRLLRLTDREMVELKEQLLALPVTPFAPLPETVEPGAETPVAPAAVAEMQALVSADAPAERAGATVAPRGEGRQTALAAGVGEAPAEPITPETVPRRREPFSWADLGSLLLSERTLHALLGLGAFLILASGVVISTANPTRLGPLPHLGAVALTTAVFYASGVFVRQRLGLVPTGTAILAMGAAFIPLVIWTLGQRDLLDWPPSGIWLWASLVSLAAYLGSHALLRDRPFAALSALAGTSVVLSITNQAGVGLEWGLCGVAVLAVGYLLLGHRLRGSHEAAHWSLFWSAQVAIPLVVVLLSAARFLPPFWDLIMRRPPGGQAEYAVGAGWWMAAAFYLLNARLSGETRFVRIAAWVVPVAFLLTLTKAPWDASWYGFCLAILALAYVTLGIRQLRRVPSGAAGVWVLLQHPACQVAVALTLAAAFWPVATADSRAPTLYVVAAVYGLAAFALLHIAPRYIAAYIVPVAFFLTLDRLLAHGVEAFAPQWQGAWLVVLAAIYLLVGHLLFGRTATGTRSLRQLALEPVYQVCTILTLVGAGWPDRLPASNALTLFGVGAVYGGATHLLGQRSLAYVSVLALLMAFAGVIDLRGMNLEEAGLAWALFAAALLAVAEGLARSSGEDRRPLPQTALGLGAWRSRFAAPLFAGGYVASLFALGICFSSYAVAPAMAGVRSLAGVSVWGFGILAAVYALSAAARRTSFFLYPASWLALITVTSGVSVVLSAEQVTWSEADWARLVSVLGMVYLALGLALDRARGHYAKPVLLLGYLLLPAAIFLSSLERTVTVQVLGLTLTVSAASAWLIHTGRHPSFVWLVERLFGARHAVKAVALSAFMYVDAWLLPVLLVLALSLRVPPPEVAHYGIMLCAVAVAYPAIGLAFRRVRHEYRMPWYMAGYALSVIGPLVTSPDPMWRTIGIASSTALYAASAVVSRASGWLYLVALFLPVVAWQFGTLIGTAERFYDLGLLSLSFLYFAASVALHGGGIRNWRHPIRATVSPYAAPFLIVGYALATLGLAVAVNQQRGLVMLGFAAGAVLYAASAWVFRQSVFTYPLVAALGVVYVVGVTGTPLDARYYGLALLPGIVACFAVAEWFQRRVDAGSPVEAPDRFGLVHWATPWRIALHLGVLAVPVFSTVEQTLWAVAWWSMAAVYGASAALSARPHWLYPALASGLVAYVATAFALAPELKIAATLGALVGPAVLLFVAVHIVSRGQPNLAVFGSRWADELAQESWVTPLLVAGALVVAVSVTGTLFDATIGLCTALIYAALFGVLAVLWRAVAAAWATVVLGSMAFEQALRVADVRFVDQPPLWAVWSLALVVLAVAVRLGRERWELLRIWERPTPIVSIVAGTAAVWWALTTAVLVGQQGLQQLAPATATVGLTTVAHAYLRRARLLAYAGVAMCEAGYMLQLLYVDVGQPQAFVLPAGLYLLAVAYLERGRPSGHRVKSVLETAGIVLLLGTSLVQAMGFFGAGLDRYAYAGFLFIECLVLFGLGALLRWTQLFFASIVVLILDVGILLAEPIRSMNTWYLAAIVGLAMVALVVFVEQKRREIPGWAETWRARLQTWT